MRTNTGIAPFGLSIVIPLHNSVATIGTLVKALEQLEVEGGLELVLVNDGSRDGTLAACRRLMDEVSVPITLVNLSRNFGEHNAVMAGLRQIRGAYVITMDDDLQNPPSEVLKLLEHTRRHGFDVVYSFYDEKHHEGWRNLGSWLTNRVADELLDKPKGLYLSSFRCMTAFVATEICRYDGPYAYVDGLILQVTQNLGRILVQHESRAVGRSGYTFSKLFALWLNMFVNFSVVPLRLSTLAGFTLAALGFLWTLSVVAEHYLYKTPLGWGSLMAALLTFSGAQLIMLGIAGEYLGRLYITTNRRPQFVVRDIFRNPGASR